MDKVHVSGILTLMRHTLRLAALGAPLPPGELTRMTDLLDVLIPQVRQMEAQIAAQSVDPAPAPCQIIPFPRPYTVTPAERTPS